MPAHHKVKENVLTGSNSRKEKGMKVVGIDMGI